MEFSFVINNTRLSSKENKIPYTGNVNSYQCLFDIHSDIEGLAWFCVFAVDDDCYVQPIIDNACYIPHEVLVSENKIKLGCYATNLSQDDYKRVSTNWLYFKSLAGAYTEGTTPDIPEPDVWETLVLKSVPKIGDNGNWYVFNIEKGEYVDTGVKASGGGSGGDIDLSEYVKKETGRGLSSIKNLRTRVMTSDVEPDYTELYYEDQEGNPYTSEFYNKWQMKDNYYTKAEVDANLEPLTNDVSTLFSDMYMKQDATNVAHIYDMTDYTFNFASTNNYEDRLMYTNTASISFVFENATYNVDYISSLSFDSGETPTRIDYTDSGILNWVGTDCSDVDGYSIFKPEANKHYDIVFYFNGRQFIGLVNGFVPSLGNVVV